MNHDFFANWITPAIGVLFIFSGVTVPVFLAGIWDRIRQTRNQRS